MIQAIPSPVLILFSNQIKEKGHIDFERHENGAESGTSVSPTGMQITSSKSDSAFPITPHILS